jgi:hypothetical protein
MTVDIGEQGTTVAPKVTVVPETFTLVDYEAPAIAQVVTELRRQVGLPEDFAIRVEVDETTPLGRAHLSGVDPAVLVVESGALEHLHRPRQFDARRAADVFGRLLFRLRDRLDPAFGNPPEDEELLLPVSSAWDVYAVGRLDRRGYSGQRGRRHYQFRVRHGFSDRGDAVFDRLWTAEGLTWADIEEASAEALCL